jgi:hypothetical protein
LSVPPEIEIGLDPVKGSNCLKINHSIYGLPQSGRNHYVRSSKQLEIKKKKKENEIKIKNEKGKKSEMWHYTINHHQYAQYQQ